jgi:PAS domain S-box-containing protein
MLHPEPSRVARAPVGPAPPSTSSVAEEAEWMLDALHEPCLLLGGGARVLAANRAFLRAAALRAEDVVGQGLFGLSGGAWDVPALRAVVEGRAPGGEVVEEHRVEVHLRHLGRRVLSANYRPFRRGQGSEPLHLLALRELPEAPPDPDRLRIVPDQESELVWLLDAGDTVQYASSLAESLLGYAGEELQGVGAGSLLHPEDFPEFKRFLAEAWAESSRGLAFRVRRKDGEYVWLGTVARPLREPDGTVLLLHLVSRDVSERKGTEQALQRLIRQNRLILDSVSDGICGLDLAGRIIFKNPAVERILGYPPGELLGRAYHESFHHSREDGSPRPPGECPICATLRDGEVRQVSEDVFWRKDGSPLAVEYSVTPALEDGKIVGAALVFRDATARKEAEAALRHARWLAGIGQTVLTLRHEINNPLTSMLADATLLEMEGNTPAEEREMVQSIVRQARRIGEVVRRLMERKDSPSLRQVGASHMLDLSFPPEG